MSPRFCATKERCIYFILLLVLLTGLFWWLEISMEERPLFHASSLPSHTQKDSFHLLGFCRDFRLFTSIQRPGARKQRREKMQSVSFQVRVTPLNTIFPSSIHLLEIFMTSFLLHLNSVPLCVLSVPRFHYPFIFWRTFGCFLFLAIGARVSVTTTAQVSLWYSIESTVHSPQSCAARSHGRFICSSLGILHTDFQHGCPSFRSQ